MSDIRINYDGIEEQLSALRTKSSEYETLLKNASALRQAVISSWEGKSANAWSETVNGYINKSSGLINVLGEFSKYAQEVITGFRTLDSECAAMINNSF